MTSNIQLPPLTQQTAPCGLGRRSNEMIAQALPMTMPDNTLPPLMGHLLDRGSLHGGNMERSPSLSSYTSSTSNYSSRSNTPGGLHSPAFPDREPYPSSTCATPTQAFAPLSRCSSCLEHGEHIPVAFGRACPECGTANHKQHPSKTSRKKRTDRIQHSKRNQTSSLVVKATKDKTEGGRRLDQTSLLGVTQRRLLGNNPSIIQEAAWKPLKSNNISTDSDTPLLYNKEHIIESAIDTIDHDNVIIEWAIDAFDSLQSEAGALRASTSSPVMFEAFINRLASGNWSAIMRHSCAHRGSKNFERPSGIVKKRHTKL